MESMDYLSFVLYYGRQKLYYNMHKLAVDGLLKFPKERIYELLNGFALALSDRKVEAARVLCSLKNEPELILASTLAMNVNLKKKNNLKKEVEEFSNLEIFFKNEENNLYLKANAFYYAALFYYLIEDYENAEKFIDDVLAYKATHEPSLILKAWIKLRDFSSMNKIPFAIEFVLKQEPKHHIEATLCKVEYLQLLNEFDKGINQLNIISIRYPEISIPLVEKLRILLTAHSWEQAQETTLRIINLEPQNIIALCIKAMLLLCRENNFKLTLHVLEHLFTATDSIQNGNHFALLRICQLFSRMCSRNTDVLKLILHTLNKLLRDYVHAGNANVDYLNEIAHLWLMLYNHKEAVTCFRAVLRLERNNFSALCGLTQCQFMENPNNIMALKQQIEFINKLDDYIQRTSSSYLLLCAKTQPQPAEALPLLIEAAELHLMSLKKIRYGIEYMHQLNPDLLIELVLQFLFISPVHIMHNQEFVVAVETFHITIKQSLCLLDTILRSCPAHLHANFLRAVVHLLCYENLHALQVLKNLTDKEDDFNCFVDAQLLLAHIQIQQEQYGKAKEALDKAVSSDFAVREYAIYHLLMGKIQRHQEQLNEAKKSFISALQIVDNKTDSNVTTPTNINAVHFSGLFNLKTDKGKIMLYLQLIYTLRDLQDFTGSEHYMQNAMEEFYGTPEEGQLLIAQAKIFLQDFHYTKALNLLNSIESDQPYYLQAKTLLADIYLKQCKNRALFAKCFKEILELRPQMDSFLMLGEAYLAIQEPELAIETYLKAFNWTPCYTLLASKLGHAYIRAHQYTKAIDHYQKALEHENNKTLKIDLIDLYLLLKQYKNAENSLSCNLEMSNSQTDDDLNLEIRTRELLLLAHIHEKLNNIPFALKVLENTLDLQKNNTKRHSVSHKEESTARICLLLAQLCTRIGSLTQAEKYYQTCLKYCATNVQVLVGLAQLYMQMNSMESCSDICKQLLQLEPTNQDASVMLADILFRKMEFTKAVHHFSVLLKSQPHYWTALVRLIQIMHRLDKITHVPEFLERAEQLRIESSKETPGLIYCQALYNWYISSLDVALQLFNNVRRDFEWGQQATSNMIEIYLNLDENIYYVYGNDAYNFNDIEHNAVNIAILTTAENLLTQFRPKLEQGDIETYNLKLLENLLHIASNQEQRIKMALHNFNDMHSCNQYHNKVGLIFATSLAYMKLKELSQAKDLLKNVIHTPWSFEESAYLERCWLFISYIYLQENKLESALHFLERILQVNKSHIKANELAGFITEKCEIYVESVSYYSKAWHLCAKTKPYIGYKLAYCLKKLKRNADALHVCHQVLKMHPDFYVIKNDILHKCRYNLRT